MRPFYWNAWLTRSNQCTITDGKDDSTVRDVRLIVTADNKVGLYDADGKALK